jgi:hypothetical protein
MSTEIKQKTVDVAFTDSGDGKLLGSVVPEERKYHQDDMVLRLHFSLMGESSPTLSPLSADYSIDDKTTVYRYDWMVGASPVGPCYAWDWFDTIALDRAMVIQLLIDPDESGCSFSEANAFLLGLQPSKDTASWVERNSEKLGESLAKLSNMTEPLSKIASSILKTSAVMSNFVTSSEKGAKNWFIYRFLDERRKCCAVEWNINRNVLHQYGPMLRGSILLAFHGSPKPTKPLTLLLRPRLNFGKNLMDAQPPFEELETKDPVALSINPRPG